MSETQLTIDDMMHAYALDAVDFAQQKFNLALDFSEDSIKNVEIILNHLHKTYGGDLSEDDMDLMIKMFGGYIAAVMQRAYGGHWKIENRVLPDFPETHYTFEILGHRIWPHFKVGKRIVNGDEDNIWIFYLYLKSDFEAQKRSGKL